MIHKYEIIIYWSNDDQAFISVETWDDVELGVGCAVWMMKG